MSNPAVREKKVFRHKIIGAFAIPVAAALATVSFGIFVIFLSYKFFTRNDEVPMQHSNAIVNPGPYQVQTLPNAPVAQAPLSLQSAFDPAGIWLGQLQVGNQSIELVFRFWLVENRLLGTAKFPIGDGKIAGTINAGRLIFTMEHEQDGTRVKTDFSGIALNANEMTLEMHGEGGTTSMLLNRHTGGRIPW